MPDIVGASISQLIEGYKHGDLSPVDVVKTSLALIEARNPELNAFREVDRDAALKQASKSAERWARECPIGVLDGIPISVKDTLMVRGFAFRQGSRATSPLPATESAPCVERSVEQGAIVLGITTCPEFGNGSISVSPLTGITRNPWNLSRHAGGSSGGAAASVAAGMVPVALGSDAGGSIRTPSSFCGVVGLKASTGVVPSFPYNVGGVLSSPGAITRCVKDSALMLNVLTDADVRDPESVPSSTVDYIAGLEMGVQGLRIALSPTLGYAVDVDPEVTDSVLNAGKIFESLGAVVEIADPGFKDPVNTLLTLLRSGYAHLLGNLPPEGMSVLSPSLREAIEMGRQISLEEYLQAHDVRRDLSRHMTRFHQQFDLLVTPTVSVVAFDAEHAVPPLFASGDNSRGWNPFLYPFNITRQPAISLPCGLNKEGLPMGLQIVGPRYREATVLRAAHAFESKADLQIIRNYVLESHR